jgi:Uma2 family endonuclease
MSVITKAPPLSTAQKPGPRDESLLEELHQSPQLMLYFEELQQFLEDEQEKRRQFYDAVSDEQKVEFINGEIVMHSPAKLKHTQAGQRLFTLLSEYVTLKKLGWVGYEKVMISLTRNDYEPDLCFFTTEKSEQFTVEQWQFPVPELAVEILSDSTEARDRGVKFKDYAAHGVSEYWLIDPPEETIEQYQLENTSYKMLCKAYSGTLRSVAVDGFEIPVRALFDDREKQKALQAMPAIG